VVDSRFKKALVAVGGAALLTASALPAVAQEEGPLLYVINKSADQQYFIDLQNSFVAATEELGGSALKADAKLDPSLGVSLVNDAISAGAAGIAITVPDQTIGPAISDAAAAAGVALVATDDGITDSAGNPVPFVGFSGPDMGGKVGAEAARILTEGGWLEDEAVTLGVLSTEVQTLSVCEDRTNASKAAMLGLGAYEACKFWAAEQPSGFKGALFISGQDVGAAAAQVLFDNIVNGVELPESTVAPTTIVGPDTYADVFDEISQANCSQ